MDEALNGRPGAGFSSHCAGDFKIYGKTRIHGRSTACFIPHIICTYHYSDEFGIKFAYFSNQQTMVSWFVDISLARYSNLSRKNIGEGE
jgi:hypothetical protein